jgi:hypothetical protein
MNWFWMNIPLMVVFFAAWTGIPLWLSLRHPDTGPSPLAASTLAEEIVTVTLPEPVAELVGER